MNPNDQAETDETDPNYGLPPKPERWGTAEEFRVAKALEPDPREEWEKQRGCLVVRAWMWRRLPLRS